jgi:hypothetical protein
MHGDRSAWLAVFFVPVAAFYLMLDGTSGRVAGPGNLAVRFFAVHGEEIVELLLAGGLLALAAGRLTELQTRESLADTNVHSRGRAVRSRRRFSILRAEFFSSRLAGSLPHPFEPVRSRGRSKGDP